MLAVLTTYKLPVFMAVLAFSGVSLFGALGVRVSASSKWWVRRSRTWNRRQWISSDHWRHFGSVEYVDVDINISTHPTQISVWHDGFEIDQSWSIRDRRPGSSTLHTRCQTVSGTVPWTTMRLPPNHQALSAVRRRQWICRQDPSCQHFTTDVRITHSF